MLSTMLSRSFAKRAVRVLVLGALVILPVTGCELAKNQLKTDRSSDMEFQDYRDALAPRPVDVSDKKAEDSSNIPELRQYVSKPTDKLKPMPLVTISVNQNVPLRDVLYELANQADYDIELDPRIRGGIIFTARNKPFDEVIDRIAESTGLRYKFNDDSVRIELDTPYHEIYKINYLSYVRTNTSSISNDIAVVSGEGADTGSKFKAEAKSELDFWRELETNLTQMVAASNVRNNSVYDMRTEVDPQITAVAGSAPVEPVLLSADGNLQVAPPSATLQVQPLPTDSTSASQSGQNVQKEDDPFLARFSINKQAGIISVFATERLHKQMKTYLDELRKSATSQVLIEAKVLEVGLTDEYAAGIDWSTSPIFGNRLSLGVDTVGDNLAPAFDPPSAPSLGLAATYISGDLNAAVQLMQRYGTVRALASPRLTVLNNQSAVLNVAKNQVYFEIDVNSSQTDSGTTTDVDSNIRNVPEGVLINVQPSIDLDNQTISMAVRPTVTRITEFVNDPGVAFAVADANLPFNIESPVPVVSVQEFDSVIQMNNGQAIVMGGLIQDRAITQQNAVPVLGEIPVVGNLFKNHGDKIEKTELVVLMKATIIKGAGNVSPTDKDLFRTFSQDRRPFSDM
ncbi:MAG: type II and III secretion system family protein [Micavibrio aeruginosavorus]|uniref:Type II and III secretion system family protein n=1 Tax=Micavibrio aeruginosavorus TaxID=349221 RepID=A0A2W4ZJV3_9BACT|nr:MAG: type II and III secretion system family protein [Micavibrio aeruginosavorus]